VAEESTTPDLVELGRGLYEAVNRRDFDAVMSFFAPDAVWESTYLEASEGVAAIRGVFEDLASPFEQLEVEVEEILDLGGGVGFAVIVVTGRPVASSGQVQQRNAFWAIWTEDKITRLKMYMYTDIDQARAAAERLAQERGQAMSQKNVEVVRRMYDAGPEVESMVKGGGDLAAHPALQLFHPECVLEEPAEIPDGGTYHGRAGIARFFQGIYDEVWDEWRVVPTEIVPGPNGVFAAVHNSGRSKNGAEVEMQVFQTFRFREGMISRATAWFDRSKARKAVGLEE
jgi:ketosteroid isomerase-like protein